MATTLKLQPPNPSHNHSPPKPIQQPPFIPGPMNPKPKLLPTLNPSQQLQKKKRKKIFHKPPPN
ncbi:hypothetical protein GBA52_016446 [Prunus armeniaca]|nr:hypothetical protein GBA52_016446 [Prunus armeniaca]